MTLLREWDRTCTNCGGKRARVFYNVPQVPVHCIALMRTREMALKYPRGNLEIAYCGDCGFISNLAFDPRLGEYPGEYEAAQGCSPILDAFQRRLARQLVERYGLRNKDILEIGCGRGEFLAMLCELGNNRGVGVDPGVVEERMAKPARGTATYLRGHYPAVGGDLVADFICCTRTLERLPRPENLLSRIREQAGEGRRAIAFFQAPNGASMLRGLRFWDFCYEQCSYFSAASLAGVLVRRRFAVLDAWTDFDDQWLMVAAQPARKGSVERGVRIGSVEETGADAAYFRLNHDEAIERWRQLVRGSARERRRTVLWDAGAKAVGFLNALDIHSEIEYVVDANPERQETYVPGTGQRIVKPESLREYRPDLVIVMNPVYRDEVQGELSRLGLAPSVVTV